MTEEITLGQVLQAVVELKDTIKQVETKLTARIDHVETTLNQKINSVEERLNKRFDVIDERLDHLDTRFMLLNDRLISTEADVFKLKKAKLT